ncbi:MAG TPA: hypothetical protein VJ183_00485 [Chloroflexia bacterium]|nr:hypothetical protein [Chloroflexia bacterium]
MVRALQRIAGITILASIVIGFGSFLIWTISAAQGLPFPLGVLLGLAIFIVVFPVGAYVLYVALIVCYEWITGKSVTWR